VGGHAGSGNHRSNPEFSEYWVSQCRPTGAFVHDRVSSSRYKGSPVSEFQEILFLNIISAVIVGETQNSLWNATMVRRRGARQAFTPHWGIVMRAAQSQAPGGHVSDPAKIGEEIHALCKTLIASEREVGS
jgi:hypothetical protein